MTGYNAKQLIKKLDTILLVFMSVIRQSLNIAFLFFLNSVVNMAIFAAGQGSIFNISIIYCSLIDLYIFIFIFILNIALVDMAFLIRSKMWNNKWLCIAKTIILFCIFTTVLRSTKLLSMCLLTIRLAGNIYMMVILMPHMEFRIRIAVILIVNSESIFISMIIFRKHLSFELFNYYWHILFHDRENKTNF